MDPDPRRSCNKKGQVNREKGVRVFLISMNGYRPPLF